MNDLEGNTFCFLCCWCKISFLRHYIFMKI